jgi:hypothetical protein
VLKKNKYELTRVNSTNLLIGIWDQDNPTQKKKNKKKSLSSNKPISNDELKTN